MKDFIKNVIEGNGYTPPDACLQSFQQNFENAVNIDWYDRGEYVEAIFYRDNSEHIAMFSPDGQLTEYKQNLTADYLPEAIKSNLESDGEIMNAVLKNKGNAVEYEVIVRDAELNRKLILLSDSGKVIFDKKL